MRTYGNQEFWFVEGIWLHQKSRQIQFFFSEMTYPLLYVRDMFCATILYKYHGLISLSMYYILSLYFYSWLLY